MADGDGMASEEEILALITRETAEAAEVAEAADTPVAEPGARHVAT